MNRRAMLAASSAFLAVPVAVNAAGPTAVKIAGVPEESITPALWAQQSGMFRRAGLDVDIVPQNSGAAIAAGVAGGSFAFGKSGIVSVIIAHSRNVPIVLVAGGGLYDAKIANVVLVVKGDSPLKTAADLNGKTIGVSGINDLTTLAAKSWLDQHGGDSSTLKIVEFPFSVVAEGLATGRIDAGGLAEPELEGFVRSGKVRVFANFFDAIAPQFMYSGWFTTTDYIAKNRTTVEAFARAMRESSAYVNAHEVATAGVLAKFTAVEQGRIEKMRRISYPTSLDPRLLQPVINACAKYKIIPAVFDAKEMIASLSR